MTIETFKDERFPGKEFRKLTIGGKPLDWGDWIISEDGILINREDNEVRFGRDNDPLNGDFHQRISIKGKGYYIHRLVAEAFIPNPNFCRVVRHLDDNPRNNHYTNLAWGKHGDNTLDAIMNGKKPKRFMWDIGQDGLYTHLGPSVLAKICKQLSDGEPYKKIANDNHTAATIVKKIYKGEIYGNIAKIYEPFPIQDGIPDSLPREIRLLVYSCLKLHPDYNNSQIIEHSSLPDIPIIRNYITQLRYKRKSECDDDILKEIDQDV